MADRYWRGGAGTWDASTTTNWSATSGGAGGASAPTSADNVFFNSASNATAYAVTVGTNAVCADISIVGPASGNVTITSAATSVINVYGSWTSAATGVAFTSASGSVLNFLATTTGKTITTNNISLGIISVIFNGVGGGWTLGSAFTVVTQGTTILAGAFSTGNFSFTGAAVNSSGTGVRSVTLGTSTFVLTGTNAWVFTTTTNLTFSGASATINCNGATPSFLGGGFTYGTVNFTSVTIGTVTVSGNNTFGTLAFTSRTTDGNASIAVGNSFTVTGTLTIGVANTAVRRFFIRGGTQGTNYTLTVGTIAALSDIEFRDITAAGASGTWSGTRLGDCGHNSNITFATPKTVYWNLAGAQNISAIAWCTSADGGTTLSAPSVTNWPLPQDTAVFNNVGSVTGTIAINFGWNLGTINVQKTGAMTISNGTFAPFFYGSVTLQSATVTTGTGTWNYAMYGVTSTFTSNGATFTPPLVITAPTGTLTLGSSYISASTATVTLTTGTLNLNSFTLTTGLFSSTAAGTRTLAFGTGNITLTGFSNTASAVLAIFNTTTVNGMTITGTPVLNATGSSTQVTATRQVIIGAHPEAQAISVNINPGNSSVDILRLATTAGAFKNLIFSNTFTGTIHIGNSILIYGDLDIGGATSYLLSASTSLITFAATSGTQNINFRSLEFGTAAIADGIIFGQTGSTATYVLTSGFTPLPTATINVSLTAGTLDLNNTTLTASTFNSNNTNTRTIAFGSSGLIVTIGLNVYVWNTLTATSLTITGTSRVEVSGAGTTGQTRYIDSGFINGTEANSPNFYVTAGVDTVNFLGTNRKYGTIDLSQFAGYFQSDNWNYVVYGDLVLPSALLGLTTSSTFSGPIVFGATSSKTISSSGQILPVSITFNGVGGTWQLLDAFTCSPNLITLTNGTFDTAGMTMSSGGFSSSNSNVRTLNIGAGTQWNLDSGTPWDCATSTNLTLSVPSPESTYLFVNSSPSTFAGGGLSYPSLGFGNMDLTITGTNTFYRLINVTGANTVRFPPSVTTTITDLYSNGQFTGYGVGYELTLNSSTPGTQATIAIPNDLQTSQDYMIFQDVNVSTASGLLYAAPNSIIGTNVTGVTTTLGQFLSFF